MKNDNAQPLAKAAYSPGSWTVDYSRHFGTYQVLGRMFGNGSMAVAECAGPEAEANARLIAAAPDLLTELRYACEALEWYASNPNNAVAQEALQNGRAAISKAEGAQ